EEEEENTELVQALRQCDGGNVQCIVMLRDDFWMAATRFMRDLEMRLLEGVNSAAVDLFPLKHAEKVLQAFGRAFGVIETGERQLGADQKQFIEQCVAGLAEEGKVICVRLALFAEMMKGKPWTPDTLVKVGGTSGVGVTFLEETFGDSTAPPIHRFHEKAARAVLKNLLPDSGTDIKGAMRSYSEICEASGYRNRTSDFEDLIGILDRELRLITPTDPEGRITENESVMETEPGEKYFQLTHDYLVPSLREWLTRKQQETRKGRAELKLSEQAALWNAKPKNQFLPSFAETASIFALTDKRQWSEPQQNMMRRSTRIHGLRCAMMVALLLITSVAGVAIRNAVVKEQQLAREKNAQEKKETQANGLVTALLGAQLAQVPRLADDVIPLWEQVKIRLLQAFQNDGFAEESEERLKISLLLLRDDPSHLDFIKRRMLKAEPSELDVLRRMVVEHKDRMTEELWGLVNRPAADQSTELLAAASILAFYDPESPDWDAVSSVVVETLVRENSLRVATWMELLRPIRLNLLDALSSVYRDEEEQFSPDQRALATEILKQYAFDQPQLLAELILEATPGQFVVLFDELRENQKAVLPLLEQELERSLSFQWPELLKDPEWKALDESLEKQFMQAYGLIADSFAFCQTMPLEQFFVVTDLMKPAGYRPFRVRPFRKDKIVHVAAIWTRDSRDWEMLHGLSAEQIMRSDRQQRSQGRSAFDVAGYLEDQQGVSVERFLGIWSGQRREQDEARVCVGLTEIGMELANKALEKQGFAHQQGLQAYLGLEGEVKYCGVRNKNTVRGRYRRSFGIRPAEFEDKEYLGKVSWDIDLSRATSNRPIHEVYQARLQAANEILNTNPHDTEQRMIRGTAYFALDNTQAAIEELSVVLEAEPTRAEGYLWRAHAYAREGNADNARQDLAKLSEVGTVERHKVYLTAIISA
ncbi:MAG: hypothetical protein P8J33_08680, partial [Pirellulaceae bacterium]|nr:hypothetical protein [Pirellulaceae bacterium]